jgi:hypothetical protein
VAHARVTATIVDDNDFERHRQSLPGQAVQAVAEGFGTPVGGNDN